MKLIGGPITLRAASLTPSAGAMTVVLGTAGGDAADSTSGAILLGEMSLLMLRCSYARHASSTTGRPVLRVSVSLDSSATTPASVSNWQPVYLADVSGGSGAAELYAETQRPNPSASGSTIFGTHPVNVACAVWARVEVGDVDTTSPGAVSALVMGGAT